MAEAISRPTRVDCAWIGKPRMSLKSVSPLLPPKPMLLRKKASSRAKVIAWVMIDRYTPVTRLRKVSQPTISASAPGTSTIMIAANQNMSKPCQYQGSSFQFRNTMKSGSWAFL